MIVQEYSDLSGNTAQYLNQLSERADVIKQERNMAESTNTKNFLFSFFFFKRLV